MSQSSPSYLFKNRFGKYYFRCRIPINIRKKYNLEKVELRKSLGTGNRTEALRLSRVMWVQMENNNYKSISFEAEMERYDRLLREGRPLYEELVLLESKPNYIPSDTDVFFDWLAPFQREAVAVYKKYITKRLIEQSTPPPVSRQPNEINVDISQENLAEQIVEKIQQADKKKLTVISLEKAFDKYIAEADKSHEWKDKDKHIVDISVFIDVVGVDRCCDLTIENIIKYRDVIINLPFRYDIDKDCQKCNSYGEMAKLPNKKPASPNTIVNKVGVVKNFLRWCDVSNYIDIDFEKPFKIVRKSKKAKKNRVGYTPDELTKLFNSRQYIQGTHKNAARHWTLLIALFTGARLNEICQLHKSNVVKDSISDIWYFDFNDYTKDRGKKTDAMIRFVPVHPQLRKLGFFRYLDSIADDSRLFPMLKKNDNSYGTSITKFFSTYKNQNNCNIEIPENIMKDFHSFRNTIINTMKQSGVPVASTREIVGHEDSDMSFWNYADPLDLPNRKKIIDKIKYPSIDWSLVKERECW